MNRIVMNKDWRFFRGDLSPKSDTEDWGGAKARGFGSGVTSVDFDDSKWRVIDIPHDFVSEGDYTRKAAETSDMDNIPEMESIDSRHLAGGSLSGGIAWYRKKFRLPSGSDNKRVILFFDGIYRNSTVYLNEYFVGNHPGGYDSFYYDITDFINTEDENVLSVRVDASGREGWWYEGGGIYRGVWLELKEDVYTEPWGVYVSYVCDINAGTADITIQTEVSNRRANDITAEVRSIIKDGNRKELIDIKTPIDIPLWDKNKCIQKQILKDIHLWDIEDPYMYTLTTEIYVNGNVTDVYNTSFGIRDINFDAQRGFYLNGKNIRIKGLCFHQDSAGTGIAENRSIFEYRIDKMKNMGANAYRSAHHMMTSSLLDICDKKGILVFDETRRMTSAECDLEALRQMVRQGRNHPSVFLWGIGNEEVFSQDRPETVRTVFTMKNEIRKLDPSRSVTSAVVCWNGKERFDNASSYIPVTKGLDVMGFNYCKQAWDDYHIRMPHQPIIITEASTNSGTRGCYSTNEDKGVYYILDEKNYQKVKNGAKAVKKDIAENEWKYFDEREYLSGMFLWTGFDYRGEPTPLSYPAVYSQFGIFDYCGFEKDNFYYYKSWWSEDPVLHIFPHWNFEGREGNRVTVHCYSNLDEIEIFVNGISKGRKSMEKNWYLTWDNVIYEKGELKAEGYKNGIRVMENTIKTTGAPYSLSLIPYKSEISDGDTAIIKVCIRDENNMVVPNADNEICFEVEGGMFIGTGNGNPGDHSSEKIPLRRAFNGLCLVLVKAEKTDIKVNARAEGLLQGSCIVKVK